MTQPGATPTEPQTVIGPPCDECVRYGEPPRPASWAFAVMGAQHKTTARMVACDYHAEWYRKQGNRIYPSERIEHPR